MLHPTGSVHRSSVNGVSLVMRAHQISHQRPAIESDSNSDVTLHRFPRDFESLLGSSKQPQSKPTHPGYVVVILSFHLLPDPG